MGRSFKKYGKQHRAMSRVFADYARRTNALVLEYWLEFRDNGLENPEWRDSGCDRTTDPILAERGRIAYVEALAGYDVEVRIVARYVNPSAIVMTGWPLVRRVCPDCGATVTVLQSLRFVDHGALVSHIISPSGRVVRTSRPCAGSGVEVS